MNVPDDSALAEEVGEWLHEQLMSAFGLETEKWATERVGRATDALNARRSGRRPLRTEVLWTQEMTAFTAPGDYIYFSRELLQRTAGDDPAALVIAHEMAHHDLGHTDLFAGRLAALRRLPGGLVAAASVRLVERLWSSPIREMEADAYGLDLCLAAGYEAGRSLALFDILEAYAIDHGDLDVVFGPDEMLRSPGEGLGGWLSRAASWKWQHARGYLPIRDRKAALEERLRLSHPDP